MEASMLLYSVGRQVVGGGKIQEFKVPEGKPLHRYMYVGRLCS